MRQAQSKSLPVEEIDFLAHHPASRKTGKEPFTCAGKIKQIQLMDFWQWSVSDLISNATRGRLAEFIVASALGIADGVRNEWDAFDLKTAKGLRIEVKSCGYLQSWYQKKLSPITFSVRKTRKWDAETGRMESEPGRHADIYIFALLAHKTSKRTLDALDLDQWEFYLVPTQKINERRRSQHSITLKSLHKLCPKPLHYKELKRAVSDAECVIGSSPTEKRRVHSGI